MKNHKRWTCFYGALGLLLVAVNNLVAQTNFAVVVRDGAWCWFSDPRAIFHVGKLYLGYVRSDGRTVLSVFDPTTGRTEDLWTSSWSQIDDHNVPSIVVRGDNTLLVAYTGHDAFQYFAYRFSSSTNPVSPSDWSPEYQLPSTGARMSYVNLFCLSAESNRIYDFSRNLNYNPTVFFSTNNGLSWSSPRIMIRTGTGGTRPYVKYASDHKQRIHLVYTDGHPRDVANSLYHIYYEAGAFYRSDGSLLKYFTNLPILHDQGERGTVIYQYSDAPQSDPNSWIPGGRAWCWDLALDSNGYPVAVFSVQKDNVTGTNWYDDRIYYYYARWTGSNWIKRFIAHAGRPLYAAEDDYAGGICLDPVDPNVVYFSSNARDPFNLTEITNVPLREAQRYEIWRGVTTNGGMSFEWTQITSNSVVDNIRPYVPRVYGGERCVLWVAGTYTTYTSFACSIVGLFTTHVPQTNRLANGVWAVDADGYWSHGSNWLNGIVANGAGCTADFSSIDITEDRRVIVDGLRMIGVLRFGDLVGSQGWILESVAGGMLVLSGSTPSIVVRENSARILACLAGTNGFVKSGPGLLVLAASNCIEGPLYVDTSSTTGSDGRTRLAHPSALGQVSRVFIRNNNGGVSTLELEGSMGPVVINCPVSISCRNNDAPAIRNLGGTNAVVGPIEVGVGGSRLIFESQGDWLEFRGMCQYVGNLSNPRTFIFSGDGNFLFKGALLPSLNGAPITVTKSGAGVMVVEGAITNSASVIISNGTLMLRGGRISTGRLIVENGVLCGFGEVIGPVAVESNGVVVLDAEIMEGPLIVKGSITNSGIIKAKVIKETDNVTTGTIQSSGGITYGGVLCIEVAGTNALGVGDVLKLFQAPEYRGSFLRVEPAAPGPGLLWELSFLSVDGSVRVVMGDCKPVVRSVSLLGEAIVVSGGGGPASSRYTVVASTNLGVPIAEWEPVYQGYLDRDGMFVFTNPVGFSTPARFYTVRIP